MDMQYFVSRVSFKSKKNKAFFFFKHTLFYWYYILWTLCSATAIG